jgi:AraC-like DNA-binding protein
MQQDKTKVWRIKELGDFDILRASFTNHAFAPHSHEEYMLGLVEAGTEGLTYLGKKVISPTGNLMMVNPEDIHTGYSAAKIPLVYRAIYPTSDFVQGILETVGFRELPRFNSATVKNTLLAKQFLEMHKSLEQPNSLLTQQSLLLETIIAFFVQHTNTKPIKTNGKFEHRAVKRSQEMIESHLTQNITLQAIAQEVGLSHFYLTRIFKQAKGLSLHQYQTLRRLQLARAKIIGGQPPTQVAIETGFYDQSHFIRQYKSIYGFTPGQQYATKKP